MKKNLIAVMLLAFIFNMIPVQAESVSISGSHIISGNETLSSINNTFVLIGLNDAPMPDGSENGTKTITVAANSDFDFGELSFSKPDTYEYTVSRQVAESDHLICDDSVYHVFITYFSDGTTAIVYQKDGESEKSDKIEYVDEYIYTLTFILHGGNINGDKGPLYIKARMNEVVNLYGAPKRSGYTFLYWKGSKYDANEKYTVKGDHTFEAIYKSNVSGVKTGDNGEIFLYMGLGILSIISLFFISRKRRD